MDASIDVFIDPANNLPTSVCFKQEEINKLTVNYAESITATHSENHNLPEPHKELLRWHYRLGHIGLRTVQFLMRSGALATSQSKQSLHTQAVKIPVHDLPKCAACQFGRQTNHAVPGKVSKVIKDRVGIMSADKLQPGQRVFIDHFVCSTRGRKQAG